MRLLDHWSTSSSSKMFWNLMQLINKPLVKSGFKLSLHFHMCCIWFVVVPKFNFSTHTLHSKLFELNRIYYIYVFASVLFFHSCLFTYAHAHTNTNTLFFTCLMILHRNLRQNVLKYLFRLFAWFLQTVRCKRPNQHTKNSH